MLKKILSFFKRSQSSQKLTTVKSSDFLTAVREKDFLEKRKFSTKDR